MRATNDLRIIKKDGSIEAFDGNKIITAISKSAARVLVDISDEDFEKMLNMILDKITYLELQEIPIEKMHQFVECALDSYEPAVAKSYREYRNYKIDFVDMMNKVYERSQAIRYIGDKENANTDSALVATKRSLIYNELNKRLYRKFFMTIDERQACNDGYIYIHDQSARLDTSINCFDRSTEFISDRGIVSFFDYQDGDTCMVLSHKGIWRKATVHCYGQQRLQKIKLRRGAGYEKEIYVTPDHRWILKDGSETTSLKIGDKLWLTPNITEFNWDGLDRTSKKLWCIGFGIGDGAILDEPNGYKSMNIRLCGDKTKYANRFIDIGYNVTTPPSLNGDMHVIMRDVHSKELPRMILNYENIRYLINGLMCADGNRNKSYEANSEFRGIQVTGDMNDGMEGYLSMAGYYVTSTRDITETSTNYGKRSDYTMHYQCYSDSGCRGWVVTGIDTDVNMKHHKNGVWCLEVEEDHSFLLAGGIPTGNCCLFNAEEVLKGGFEMGNIFYNEPNTLDVAFDVLSDVILATASQQYGGFTVPEVDKILSYYAEKSYKNYYNEYIEIACDIVDPGWDPPSARFNAKAERYAMKKLTREFEQGWQGIEMKLNTVGSSRGDYPFITMTFGLATDKFGKLAARTFMNVHMEGQGKSGFKRPVLFPKLVFLYDENIHGKDGVNEDLWELAVKCSSVTMYPDHLSLTGDGYVPSIYKKYGRVISPMGCVHRDELVTYKFHGNLYVEGIGRMWDRIKCAFPQKVQILGEPHMYIDINPKVVQIYDKENGFVGTTRMVKNRSHNWARVTLSNGRILECTTDHPLPVKGKGRTLVSDLEIGDVIPINKSQYVDESYSGMYNDYAWALGLFLCDGCYDDQATLSIAMTGEDEIINDIAPIMKKYYNAEMSIKEQHRGKKGDYIDLRFSSPKNISKDLHRMFGGLQKIYRQIPEFVFRSPRETRLAFLAGMVDADGYINNLNHVSIIQLGSTNKELALQQMALMQSLGIRASVYPNKYDKAHPANIRYRVEGEAISELKDYIRCEKKCDNFNDNMRVNSSRSDIDEGIVTNIELMPNRIDWSYDVTTESDHFDVSGIYSHNCRAFLSPWFERGGMEPADDDDKPVFVGRFNVGAVSLHLPMILAKSRKENKDFYEVLDYYLEMIRGIHKRTYEYVGNLRASTNPVQFCEGGILGGHLKPNEKVAPLLKPMTSSFGITALNELQRLYNNKSLIEDSDFAMEVLTHINNKVEEFKKADGWLYAIYGTPAENLCNTQVHQFRKLYGVVEGVSDREYVSNSFHCHVTEDITPIEKQDIENKFWNLCNGGKIQYVRYPINYNMEAIKTLLKRAMSMGYYEGVNLSLSYCNKCGYQQLEMDKCPKCGGDDIISVDRMNGYLAYSRIHGDTRLNAGKMAEIADRVSM